MVSDSELTSSRTRSRLCNCRRAATFRLDPDAPALAARMEPADLSDLPRCGDHTDTLLYVCDDCAQVLTSLRDRTLAKATCKAVMSEL